MSRIADQNPNVPAGLTGTTDIQRHIYADFHGGWRPDKALSQLAENELSDVLNLEFDAGGAVRKRGGFEEYTDAVAGLDNIEFVFAPRVFTSSGLFPVLGQEVMVFPKNDGELYQAVFGELEEEFQTPGAGSDLVDTTFNMGLASASAANHFRVWPIQVVTFDDKIYITTLRYGGEDNGVTTNATEDGTSSGATRPLRFNAQDDDYDRMVVADLEDGSTTSPRFPRARCAIAYHDRVFAANVHSQGDFRFPSRIYWSEPGDAETWETTSWIGVAADDGTEITSLMPMGEQIMIFKNNGVFSLVGTDEDTFALYPLSNRLGCDGTFATTEGNGVVYFFDTTTMSIWQYDGARFEDIGAPISEHVRQNINLNAAHKANLQVFGSQLWFSYPKGDVDTDEDDENTETLVFDLQVEAWTRWDFGVTPNIVSRYTDYRDDAGGDAVEGDSNPYYAISAATQDDHIMKGYQGNVSPEADTVWTDNGTNFTFQFRTAWLSPDSGMERKRIRRLEFLTAENSDQIDIDLYRDFIDSAWQEFNFDPLAETSSILEYHLQQSSVDVIGMFNWLSVDIQATHANEAQVNRIGMRYSFRPSPRGDVGGTGYTA